MTHIYYFLKKIRLYSLQDLFLYKILFFGDLWKVKFMLDSIQDLYENMYIICILYAYNFIHVKTF